VKVAFTFISMPVGGAEDFAVAVSRHLPDPWEPVFVCLRDLGAMGEELKALVLLKPEVDAPAPNNLIGWCRDRLSHYKCPRSVEFVDDLGRNTMGKINKRKLRAPYWEKA